MVQRPLLTADEIKTLEQNKWILMKSRCHPLISIMKRYNEWGIELDSPYQMPENAARRVKYADKDELRHAVLQKYPPEQVREEFNIDDLEEPPRSNRKQVPFDDSLIN